jgi:A/G-specific adenine glycosylase
MDKTIHIIYESDIAFLQNHLLTWFDDHRRDFPWRHKSATNYEIITSTVFLQRTSAQTVAKFLPVFFNQYPSWEILGKASVEEIAELIKPLGLYNQRGRRLFKLAQEFRKRTEKTNEDRNRVEDVSFMGQYLTNAYELYILKKNAPLLDVNMARLLERFFGHSKISDINRDPYLQTLAYRVVNTERSKELNWAILDYGALICKKINPECDLCVLNSSCINKHQKVF